MPLSTETGTLARIQVRWNFTDFTQEDPPNFFEVVGSAVLNEVIAYVLTAAAT